MRNRIDEFLNGVISDIKEDQDIKDIRASGASANSLKQSSTETSGEIKGLRYIGAQRFGRRPGKFPPIDDIKQWIDDKGINPTDISKDSLAFLIARKIAREGTDIYTNKRPALAVSDIIEVRLDELKSNLLSDKVQEIRKQVVSSLKNILQFQ
jgi:hypothetical protein